MNCDLENSFLLVYLSWAPTDPHPLFSGPVTTCCIYTNNGENVNVLNYLDKVVF